MLMLLACGPIAIGLAGLVLGVASFGFGIYQNSENEARMEKQLKEQKADAEKQKYQSTAMNLRQVNQNIDAQKRALAVDHRQVLLDERKRKYKNHGQPARSA